MAVTEGALDFGTWERIFYGSSTGGGAGRCWSRSSASGASSAAPKSRPWIDDEGAEHGPDDLVDELPGHDGP